MKKALSIATGRTRDLNDRTRSDIIRVCIEAHQQEIFDQLFSFLPPEGLHILGYLHGDLVSHAVVTTRWLEPEGMPVLRTAYVDAVATSPRFQGRGCASAVMRHLAGSITTHYDIACLETERVSFYKRLGWEAWRGPLAGRSDCGMIATPGQKGIMILRLPRTPDDLNLDSLLTIECQEARIW